MVHLKRLRKEVDRLQSVLYCRGYRLYRHCLGPEMTTWELYKYKKMEDPSWYARYKHKRMMEMRRRRELEREILRLQAIIERQRQRRAEQDRRIAELMEEIQQLRQQAAALEEQAAALNGELPNIREAEPNPVQQPNAEEPDNADEGQNQEEDQEDAEQQIDPNQGPDQPE